MRAAVLEAPERLTVGTHADPEPAAGELLLQVAACGVCGTDRSIFRGEYAVSHPLIMGSDGYFWVQGDSAYGTFAPAANGLAAPTTR